MIEVGVNNRWLLHPIDSAYMTSLTETKKTIERLRAQRSNQELTISVLETNFQNQQFFDQPSDNRIAELALWRREVLFPKTHLLISDLRIWGGFTSIWPTAFDQIDRQLVADNIDAAVIDSQGTSELQFPDARSAGQSESGSFETATSATFCDFCEMAGPNAEDKS